MNNNAIQGPFIKVYQTFRDQNKANKFVESLKQKGETELFTYHDIKSGLFHVGTFDYARLAIFNQMNNAPNMERIPCNVCNSLVSENDFFKCQNCGMFECAACGLNRLYGGKIPIIHSCGQDDFEFLANIGSCVRCKQPLGFRSVPQAIRMRMMAGTLVGRAAMVSGIVGCYVAEELFIEKEIVKIYNLNRSLHATLLQATHDRTIWFPAFIALKSNYHRMFWSVSYIKEVLQKYLKLFGVKPNLEVNAKLNSIGPHFDLFKVSMTLFDKRMRDQISTQEFEIFMSKTYELLKKENMLSPRMDQSLLKIIELSPIMNDMERFTEFAPHVAGFFQLDILDQHMQNYLGILKC